MNPGQIRDFYDRLSPRYDSTTAFFDRHVTRTLRQEFGAHLHGRVLEIAIGTGLNLPFYSSAVNQASGHNANRVPTSSI